MTKSLLTFFIVLFAAISVFPSESGQCSTYFQSGYRAVDKIRRAASSSGDNFVLQDWNGDGRSDFWNFRFNQATQTQEIIVFPALPTGYWNWDAPIIYTTTLGEEATTNANGCCFSYQFLDFDLDGKIDMLIGRLGSSTYRIHRNMGNGTLVPQAQITSPAPAGTFIGFIGYYDITGDGRLDWIYPLEVSATGQETISYSAGNADGSFGASVPILANDGTNEVNDSVRRVGDFDGDGKFDIAYSSFSSPDSRVRILRNMGGGTFVLGNPTPIPRSLSFAREFSDLNGDGRTDILMTNGNTLYLLYAQADGTFTISTQPITNASSSAIAFRDFNNDGRRDLIMVGNTDYEVFTANGAGTFTSQFYNNVRLTENFPSIYLHFEDFNADGKADVYEKSHNVFNAFSEEVVVVKTNVCDRKGQTRAMQFGSALIPDIGTWNGSTGEWRTGTGEWNATTNTAIRSFNWGSGALGDVPAPGDFDGDGKTDYTVYRNGEGNWYSYLSATSSWSVTRFGLPGDIPIPNDFDGGGKTDIAVFRPSDGNWYIWYTETQQFSAVHWGANGDRPVPADFDADGKTDIAVFRPSEGNWYYVRSSDFGYVIYHWGSNGDVPLPADYDGDGKADLTIYRAGTWYILRSGNGAFTPIFWGTTGDVPIPFLNRGEVAMPTVYRPSDGRWYGNLFPVGYALRLSGGSPVYFGLPNN